MPIRIALILSFALATCFSKPCRAEDQPVHLFILSGQSNMAGMNPKTGFESEAKELFGENGFAYLKVARGGQPIRKWIAEWPELTKKHGLKTPGAPQRKNQKAAASQKNSGHQTVYYQPILDQYAKLIEKHPNPASVTFCWMQGVRDAKEKLSAAYADALGQLINNLRRDLKQPNMYFVIGRLSDFSTESHWEAVRDAQVQLSKDDPRGAWVDCDDLNNKERNGVKRDDLHYTADGYELLGRRYVRQAKAMIDGNKPADNGRPE